ncbi:MAG: ATP-binding protein [Thermodesulfovibrionales bacterium]|jgi:two-component system phosphate regulon sensor histidine kinase PhoR
MKRVLFRRILLIYIIIAPLLLLSLELYLSREVKDSYITNLKKSLGIQARLIADQIPLSFSDSLDAFCKQFKDRTGARVTVIDDSGKVLGDSDEPANIMENHANRPEIKEADISGVGSSMRFSSTLRRNQFYLAVSTDTEPKRFLRLSMPLYEVEQAVNEIRMRVIIASLSILFIALLTGLFQTRKVTKSIEEIAEFSKEVAEGNLKKRLFLKNNDELGQLGKNIIDMADELNAKLIQSEEEKWKIAAIIQNMSDGLILTDTKGRIILSNDAVSKLFGISSGIDGKTLMEAFRKAELMELIDMVVEGGHKISREIEIAHPRELHLMVTASPFSSPKTIEELSGVVLTFHDITRLKKLEEVRKDFVANVSHEIKTPITAIKGFAETLLEGALDDRESAFKFLETIKSNSERLNSLVNDLLTLSRIELGDITIEKTDVNPDEVTETVFATLKDKGDAKGLYLKKEISPEVIRINADRGRLIQILINLVDNGIKYTDKGGVTIRMQNSKFKIQNEKETSDSSLVEIIVEDTGIGIPKKHLSRLGERFYRVDRARSRDLGGTGLGLAIVKHLVKAHGWDMEIQSSEGTGTKIRLILPVA